MFDAILFDLDGTLIDTESLAMRSGALAFASLGCPQGADILPRLIGVDQPNAETILRAALPDLDLAALAQRWQAEQTRLEETEGIALKPGADALLAAFADKYPMCIVTSSGRANARAKLERTGLRHIFRDVITRDDVTAPKPDPAPYLLAASRLSVSASRCLVFEDSEPGAQAAFQAGMTVVQVPDVIPSSGRFAHHIADNLIDGAIWARIWA